MPGRQRHRGAKGDVITRRAALEVFYYLRNLVAFCCCLFVDDATVVLKETYMMLPFFFGCHRSIQAVCTSCTRVVREKSRQGKATELYTQTQTHTRATPEFRPLQDDIITFRRPTPTKPNLCSSLVILLHAEDNSKNACLAQRCRTRGTCQWLPFRIELRYECT